VSAEQVDEYLRGLEEPKRSTLEALRRTILEIVPDAEQVISYRVPAFRVGGMTSCNPRARRCSQAPEGRSSLRRDLPMSDVQPTHPARHRRRHDLPRLGKRGGGWVAAQVILIAAIFLSALVGLSWPASIEPVAYGVGALLLALGIGLLGAGGAGLGPALTPFPAPRTGGELRTAGAYRLVRHPMYGGGILISLGWSTIFATVVGLVLTVILALFATLKSHREELWLEQQYPGYDAYRRRTPHRLIPFVW
jgi:protein-S-isoprenylcysteine O-methyltransferase Ste14